MTDWRVVWKNQQNRLKALLQTTHPYCSGRIYLNFWRTDETFPCIYAFIMDDTPEVIQHGAQPQRYTSHTNWRMVYRVQATDTPENDHLSLMSGIGGLANLPMDYAVQSGCWYRSQLSSVDFTYESPSIAPGVILEGAVDIILRSEAL